jgi:hypothetical protein
MLFDRYPELKTILVTTKTDRTFRGVLRKRRRDCLILCQVQMLKGAGEATEIAGEVIIERANVDFLQVVT